MGKYRFLKSKPFESIEKFEKRLNEDCGNGWRVISLVPHSGILLALLEKVLL